MTPPWLLPLSGGGGNALICATACDDIRVLESKAGDEDDGIANVVGVAGDDAGADAAVLLVGVVGSDVGGGASWPIMRAVLREIRETAGVVDALRSCCICPCCIWLSSDAHQPGGSIGAAGVAADAADAAGTSCIIRCSHLGVRSRN